VVTKDIDLSEFLGEPKKRKCLIGAFLETLSEEDQEKVNAALDDEQYKSSNIHRWLTRKPGGADLKANLVSRHRNKACPCPK
jgi:hypothetical protein